MNRFIIILLAVIIVIGSILGVFVWQQEKIADRDAEITTLNEQLENQQPLEQPTDDTAEQPANTTTQSYTSDKGTVIVLYHPVEGDTVNSPLGIIGQVPGNWSFEANFPVRLEDADGNVIARGTGEVLGDWMTEDLVPFSATLAFDSAPNGTGNLILEKDNPSDLPENADSVTIPVTF